MVAELQAGWQHNLNHYLHHLFQEGSRALSLDGLTYALFGPYPDQCVTAPSTCTTGFTFGLWLRKSSTCSTNNLGIVTTQKNSPPSEGIRISCVDGMYGIEYKMFVHPDSMCKLVTIIGSGADVWFHATMVWSVGSTFKIYENGQWAEDGSWQGGSYPTDVNTEQKLAFGIPFTDQDSDYGTAYVDAVKMYNRPLTAEEVQALYNSY